MKKFFSKIAQRAFALAISIMVVTNTFAQGAAGIDAASSELATYMDPLGNMMMILGGLVGLVGAVRVYLISGHIYSNRQSLSVSKISKKRAVFCYL